MKINVENQLPQEIIFLIHTKAFELESKGIQRIDPKDIKSYLYDHQWKDRDEISLCDAVDDIMSLRFSSLYDYLSTKVIKEAQYKRLEDFENLILK